MALTVKKAERELTRILQTMIKKSKQGFTLVEILIVIFITGALSSVLLPRISFYFEPPSAVLQRAIEEASDKALSGIPIRLTVKSESQSKRGYILAEALTKREIEEDSLSSFLGTNVNRPAVLEWQNIKMKYLPDNDGWKFEPEVIYFYTDGSCSPAKISWVSPNSVSYSDADEYILTVTGYCTKLEKK